MGGLANHWDTFEKAYFSLKKKTFNNRSSLMHPLSTPVPAMHPPFYIVERLESCSYVTHLILQTENANWTFLNEGSVVKCTDLILHRRS